MFKNLTDEQIKHLEHIAGEYHKLAVLEEYYLAKQLRTNQRNFSQEAARCQSFHAHCEEIHQFRHQCFVEQMRRRGYIVE